MCIFLGRYEKCAYLHHIILLSQSPDPRRCKAYTLIKMCKCAKYFLIFIFELLCHESNSFLGNIEKMGYAFSLFFWWTSWYPLFSLMHFGMDIIYLYLFFFLYSPNFF